MYSALATIGPHYVIQQQIIFLNIWMLFRKLLITENNFVNKYVLLKFIVIDYLELI